MFNIIINHRHIGVYGSLINIALLIIWFGSYIKDTRKLYTTIQINNVINMQNLCVQYKVVYNTSSFY